MKIAIYSRKSKFTGVGDSIENQIQMCKDFVKSKFPNEKIEYDEYEDEGFTGSNLNRPQFKLLMKNIKDYDVLICYRLDRISRNVADFSSTLEILQANHCDFISIKEQFDTSSPMGRAMIYIASVFAQLERETIAERIKDNMLEMGKNGRWTGGRTPLGYNSESTTWIDDEGNERKSVKLVPNEEELKLVRLIYEIYLKEGSLHKAEVWFTQHNIRSNRSILLEMTSLKLILQNPVYVISDEKVIDFLKKDGWNVYGEPDNVHGLLTYNKTQSVNKNGKTTKIVKDKKEWIAAMSSVPGVIDSETWLRVQKQFAENKNTFPHLGKTNNALLTGKLRCSLCENNMIVIHGHISKKTGKKTFYYSCSMKRRSHGTLCKAKNIKAEELEKAVLIELEKLSSNRGQFLEDVRKKNKLRKKDTTISARKSYLEKEIKDKKNSIDKLVDKLSLDDSIADILIDKIKKLREEIKNCQDEINNINSNIQEANDEELNLDFIESILAKCTDIRNIPRDEQKKYIDLIVDTIYYDGNTNSVIINFIGNNKKKLETSGMRLLEMFHFEQGCLSSIQKYNIFRKFFQSILLAYFSFKFSIINVFRWNFKNNNSLSFKLISYFF